MWLEEEKVGLEAAFVRLTKWMVWSDVTSDRMLGRLIEH